MTGVGTREAKPGLSELVEAARAKQTVGRSFRKAADEADTSKTEADEGG